MIGDTARRPKITVSADGTGLVSQAGVLLLTGALRLFSTAGRLVRGRRLRLRLAASWPWAAQLTSAITRLHAYAPG